MAVIDVQEAFRSVMNDFNDTIPGIVAAVNGFELLGIPIVVTEQYPKGLGRTIEEITLSLPESAEIFEKTTFSSYGSAEFAGYLKMTGAKQILVCGVETHVCVNQTVQDLLAAGYEVHILSDCVASRFAKDKAAGLAKMYHCGAIPSSVEMALFELMNDSKHPKFKEIQALIK